MNFKCGFVSSSHHFILCSAVSTVSLSSILTSPLFGLLSVLVSLLFSLPFVLVSHLFAVLSVLPSLLFFLLSVLVYPLFCHLSWFCYVLWSVLVTFLCNLSSVLVFPQVCYLSWCPVCSIICYSVLLVYHLFYVAFYSIICPGAPLFCCIWPSLMPIPFSVSCVLMFTVFCLLPF